jgi:hypothetical protein
VARPIAAVVIVAADAFNAIAERTTSFSLCA